MGKRLVLLTESSGIDPESKRLYTVLYVADKQNDEYNVHVSCKDVDLITDEAEDLTIEFLRYSDMSSFIHPFNAKLFEQIEDIAIGQLRAIKCDTKINQRILL